MIITENPAAARAMILAAQAAQDTAHPRAPGLHVSDLIGCLRRAWYRKNEYPEPAQDPEDLTILLMGQGHHGLLQCEGQYEVPVILRLSEHEIHGTVDLLLPGGLPVEIKTTRYSSRKPLSQLPHYIEQLASYCLALGQYRGRLAIWHLMGDYSQNRKPVLKVYDIEWTDQEMMAWQSELHARADTVSYDWEPDLYEHYEMECGFCPFHIDQGGPCPGGPGKEGGFFVQDELPAWARGA